MEKTKESKHLVISVHGIRTFGGWQKRLKNLLKSEDTEIEVFDYQYGYFSILAFLIPFTRWLVVKRFRAELIRTVNLESWGRIEMGQVCSWLN
tara:strand:- start:9189 stop:9467 length:279 start_codon:yes stop_codon:yes gene_type:complete